MEEWGYFNERDLQNWKRGRGLHELPALHLWRRPALPHDGGLQPQAEAVAARTAPEEEVQAMGTYLAEGSGLGS